MQDDKPIVIIVDDDTSMRSSLQRLLLAAGIDNITFSCAQEFLSASLHDRPCCLLLDIRMPGMDGMELQSELVKIGRDLPIVFITGHGDVPMSVQAMRAGAVNFLQKPFESRELLDAINESFEKDRNRRLARTQLKEFQERASGLTPREQEIFAFVISGALNKQIAYELGIQEGTVKVHRRQVMEKMKAKSLAELVKMAATLGYRGAACVRDLLPALCQLTGNGHERFHAVGSVEAVEVGQDGRHAAAQGMVFRVCLEGVKPNQPPDRALQPHNLTLQDGGVSTVPPVTEDNDDHLLLVTANPELAVQLADAVANVSAARPAPGLFGDSLDSSSGIPVPQELHELEEPGREGVHGGAALAARQRMGHQQEEPPIHIHGARHVP